MHIMEAKYVRYIDDSFGYTTAEHELSMYIRGIHIFACVSHRF